MKIIDLTLQMYQGMPVFPGDPDVVIEQIQTLDKDGWNMKRIHMNLHDGTHINAPVHMCRAGRTLNSYELSCFITEAVLYQQDTDIDSDIGVIFGNQNIDWNIAKSLVSKKAKLIGLSAKFDFDIEIERFLLENGVLSVENLINTEQLPKKFMFYAIPLNIKDADGSPVRAFAIL